MSPGLRARLRGLLLVAVGILYAVSIPWYRGADAAPARWLGLPDWVAVAALCYVAAAVCNSLAWLLTDVSDDVDDAEDPGP